MACYECGGDPTFRGVIAAKWDRARWAVVRFWRYKVLRRPRPELRGTFLGDLFELSPYDTPFLAMVPTLPGGTAERTVTVTWDNA